jgi:hypothetical protein
MTMGINARCSDVKTELIERMTHSREDLKRELRNQIRQGRLSVMDYLMNHSFHYSYARPSWAVPHWAALLR